MIAVAGESLMDLIAVEDGGLLTARPGGAAFNLARFLAGLGVSCSFLSRLSTDPFGARLAQELHAAGVALVVPEPVAAPTTVAVAQLDPEGVAEYSFYGNGTSATLITPADLPAGVLNGVRAFTLGGLGIVFEPIRSTLTGLALDAAPDVLLVLDPNCRPTSIADAAQYRDTIDVLISRTDILKVSQDDLAFLAPGADPLDWGLSVIDRGVHAVIVTNGPEPTLLATREGATWVPVPATEVADTIGAGDAFLAGLLAWFEENRGLDPRSGSLEVLRAAAVTAAQVAAAVCTMRGAALPSGFSWHAHA